MRFADDLPRTVVTLWLLCLCSAALAAPSVRYQIDQRGDLVLIGNTLGFDCRAGVPRPLVGSIGMCGSSVDASEIDVLWRADDPLEGQARADRSISPAMARSTAVLALPKGAVVTYARLYWAAGRSAGSPAGAQVLLERPSGFSQTVAADGSVVLADDGPGMLYQSTADITSLIQAHAEGPYRVSRVDAISPVDLDKLNFAAWSMVVLYRNRDEPPRTLTVLEGLERVDSRTQVAMTLENFIPVEADFSARLGVIAYEGDDNTAGDRIKLNGTDIADTENPAANFFNGTRSVLGAALGLHGDLPRMSGKAGSGNGLDLDVVDVSRLIAPQSTSANVLCTTSEDVYYVGTLVGSVATRKPVFTDTDLLYTNLSNPGGAVRPGDRIEYTLIVRNTGSDTSVDTLVRDVLPQGITYVPGSLRVAGAGAKTDAAGDDQAEYDAMTRTLVVRAGTGATAKQGGSISTTDAPVVIKFQVTVDADTKDKTISNQAAITAKGEIGAMLGLPPASWRSGDGTFPNRPTSFVVRECDANLDCRPSAPICDKKGAAPRCTNTCVGQGDCKGTATGLLCLPTQLCGCLADGNCLTGKCDIGAGICMIPQADLQVTVRLEPDPPASGVPVTHIISVENKGPGTAAGVTVVYAIPEGAMVKDIAPSGGWTCTREERRVICVLATPLPPGTAPEIRISTELSQGATQLDVVVAARAAAEDLDPANNSVFRTVELQKDRIQLAGGGLGCSAARGAGPSSPQGLLFLLAAAGALAFSRRRATLAALLCLCGPLAGAARGQKQGFQLGRYEPTPAGEWSFLVDHPWYSRTRYVAAGITLNYAHNPLILGRLAQDDSFHRLDPVISHQLIGHLDVAGSFLDRVTLSASLPIVLLERGQEAAGVRPQDGLSVSDPRLGLMVRLYGQPSEGPISVSLGAHFWIPLRKFTDSLPSQSSDQEMRFLPKVVLAGFHRFILWSATLGFLYRSEATIGNLSYTSGSSVGSELQLGGRVYYADLLRRFALGPELHLSTVLTSGNAFKKDYTALELLLGGHYNVLRLIALGLAAGIGVLREPGTPDFRLLVRVAYAPLRSPQKRPAPTPAPAQKIVALAPAPVQQPKELVPPPSDRDSDRVVDEQDACPDTPGAPSPDPKKNGCPGLVTLTQDKIKILEPVFFATDKDVILPQSFPVLTAVADALKAQAGVMKVSIEGHTDNVGHPAYNIDLSRRRARSVMKWLIENGVGAERLSAEGFGPLRPVDTNKTAQGRAKNRRVEFQISESK